MPDRTPVTFRLRTGLDSLSRGAFVRPSGVVHMHVAPPHGNADAGADAGADADESLGCSAYPFQTQFWLVGPTLFVFVRRQGTHPIQLCQAAGDPPYSTSSGGRGDIVFRCKHKSDRNPDQCARPARRHDGHSIGRHSRRHMPPSPEHQTVDPSTPPTQEDPDVQRAACRRCAGDCDPFSCRLVGLGPLFRARVDSPCAWERCVHLPDNRRFNIHGPLHEHSLIIGLGDMGYLHTECASAMLKPYENDASMDELTARVDDMSRGLPIDIAQARGRTRGTFRARARVPARSHASSRPRSRVVLLVACAGVPADCARAAKVSLPHREWLRATTTTTSKPFCLRSRLV